MIWYTEIASPWGDWVVARSERGVVRIGFPQESPDASWVRSDDGFADIRSQLADYFAGSAVRFDLPLDLRGTPFQCQVWEALQRIPHGTTISYADLAQTIGRSTAARAVGAANGRNPVPIIVPCHRVIGSNQRLTGFRGGLALKERLLRLEGIEVAETLKRSSGEPIPVGS